MFFFCSHFSSFLMTGDLYLIFIFIDTGKCIPITRGEGIYQQHMNEALHILGQGEWVEIPYFRFSFYD
jgi:hypothetical protein